MALLRLLPPPNVQHNSLSYLAGQAAGLCDLAGDIVRGVTTSVPAFISFQLIQMLKVQQVLCSGSSNSVALSD